MSKIATLNEKIAKEIQLVAGELPFENENSNLYPYFHSQSKETIQNLSKSATLIMNLARNSQTVPEHLPFQISLLHTIVLIHKMKKIQPSSGNQVSFPHVQSPR